MRFHVVLAFLLTSNALTACVEINGHTLVGQIVEQEQERARAASLDYLHPVTDLYDKEGVKIKSPTEKTKQDLKIIVEKTIDQLIPAFQNVYAHRAAHGEIASYNPNILHRINVQILDSRDYCAPSASIGRGDIKGLGPYIFVPWCFFQSGIYASPTINTRFSGNAFGDALIKLDNSIAEEAAYAQLQENLLFVFGHEMTHIWLSDDDSAHTSDKEIRADSWGVITSMAVSPAASLKAKRQAEFSRTLRVSTSSAFEIALANTDFGAAALFDVYSKTPFAHGDNSHLPVKDRINKVNDEIKEIFKDQVSNVTFSDLLVWKAGKELLPDLFDAGVKAALSR